MYPASMVGKCPVPHTKPAGNLAVAAMRPWLQEHGSIELMSTACQGLSQGCEDLIGGWCLAEPLLEHLERVGVGLVAVSGAGVGDAA
jgi:hypothetical protein